MKVIEWIDDTECEERDLKDSIGGLGGWVQKGHRWTDYINAVREEYRPYYEALRESIIENRIRCGGDVHQDDMIPVFEDNTIGSFSFRAWGDLLAATWATEEDKDYCYMDFYCRVEEEDD